MSKSNSSSNQKKVPGPLFQLMYRTRSHIIAKPSLPETRRMPSADGFAECRISNTRQSYYLPSACQKALGKQTTLGLPKSHTLPSASHVALGELTFAECHMGSTRQTSSRAPHTPVTMGSPSRPLLFAECPQGDTRQTPLC